MMNFAAIIGLVVALIGIAGLIAPERVVEPTRRWQARARYLFAIAVRLVFGVVFILSAADCRFIPLLYIIGVIPQYDWEEILGRIGFCVSGTERYLFSKLISATKQPGVEAQIS